MKRKTLRRKCNSKRNSRKHSNPIHRKTMNKTKRGGTKSNKTGKKVISFGMFTRNGNIEVLNIANEAINNQLGEKAVIKLLTDLSNLNVGNKRPYREATDTEVIENVMYYIRDPSQYSR